MKRVVRLFISVFIVLSVWSLPVWGAPETSTVSSPKCDAAQIRELAGDALLKIEPAKWEGNLPAFVITLDTSKLTFSDLAKRMRQAGCY